MSEPQSNSQSRGDQAREAKRQKRAAEAAERAATKPLDPSALSQSHLDVQFSPACVWSNRIAAVACPTQAHVYLSSGRHIHATCLPLDHTESVNRGKDGILIPKLVPAQPLTQLPVSTPCEVQSLSLCLTQSGTRAALCAADARGHGAVHLLDTSPDPASSSLPVVATYTLDPPSGSLFEQGWCGSVVRKAAGAGGEVHAVTASHFGRTVCAYQGAQLLRTFHTVQQPTALTVLPEGAGGLVACAEEHQLSLWDVRAGEAGGLVQRVAIAPGGSPLYALAWSPASGGLLGAAGAERAVQMMDPRKWRTVYKWGGCTKYTTHHLALSSVCQEWCYASGLDYELCAGRWDGSGQALTTGNTNSGQGGHGRAAGPSAEALEEGGGGGIGGSKSGFGFRGCSRWLGMALAQQVQGSGDAAGRDVVVAHTQNGTLYSLTASPGV